MLNGCFQLAFIGPGGPEIMVIMLVLIMVFGAKDAPKIFRKINEMLNTVRNTADSFKREIMYGDLNNDTSAADDNDYGYDEDHDNDYDYSDDDDDEERASSDDTFQSLEKDLADATADPVVEEDSAELAEESVPTVSDDEVEDAKKT